MSKAPAYRRQAWSHSTVHVGRHSPTKVGLSNGESPAAGMISLSLGSSASYPQPFRPYLHFNAILIIRMLY
jgi:hypothetical protein